MQQCLVLLAAAAAAGVARALPTTPTQVHLAFAGADGMRVAWKTNASAPSTCIFGLANGSMTRNASGSSVEYLPAHGFHHAVRLAPLAPSTRYAYSCGSAPAQQFTTPAPVGVPATFSAMIYGDWGYLDSNRRLPTIPVDGMDSNWTASLTRELLETLGPNGPGGDAASFDFQWIVGDIAYADDAFAHIGELLHFDYEDVYDGFMEWSENISNTRAWMVSAGNHESECHSPYCVLELNSTGRFLSNFSAYNARWVMPGPESSGVLSMWFSWDYADVHFVSIDTSTDFPNAPEGETGDSHMPWFPAGHFAPNGTYMRWLEADLKAARARNVRWLIAGGHRPTEDLDGDASAALLALFKAYGVDVYFAGHGHSYYRYDAAAYGDNTIHIMVGGAGCDEMPWPKDQLSATVDEDTEFASPRAACEAWCQKPAVRRAFTPDATSDPCRYCLHEGAEPLYVSDNMAIGRLSMSPGTLKWELLRAPEGTVLDTLVLNKPL